MTDTYERALSRLLDEFRQSISGAAAGTCNPAVIDDIIDWVVRRDPDASQKFGDAVKGGEGAYSALKDRLGHDQNALDLITRCEAEARTLLANRGYPG